MDKVNRNNLENLETITIGEYVINLDKLFVATCRGKILKTNHTTSEITWKDGFVLICQKLKYKLDKDFILDNFSELSKYGVIDKKGD